MILKTFSIKHSVLAFAAVSLLMVSVGCNDNVDGDAEGKDSVALPPGPVVGGKLFSVPSPIQTAFLIKQSGSPYNKDLLNVPQNFSKYTSTYQKALNLGVYGADLGYVSLYEQTQDAIMYMQSVKKLADDLGVTGAFDASLVSRFQNNIGNKDSLLVLVGSAYRASDGYLRNNERNDVSSLVLAGGWIETLSLSINVAKAKNNPDIIRRIAEQKTSIKSLVELLEKYSNNEQSMPLIQGLKDLQLIFDQIEFTYSYEKPSVDVEKHMSVINSKTEVKVSPQQIDSIGIKIKAIRDQITG